MGVTIKPDRLLADLAALRGIGGTGSGVIREALTPADMEARRWLATRFAEAGLRPVFDPVGNLFGLPPLAEGQPLFLVGSHSDTQPEGGWLDGAYGVICGLEIARAAREAGEGDVAVVSFSDEEGTFEPLLGSRIWSGELRLDVVLDRVDRQERRLGSALAAVPELQGAEFVPTDMFSMYIEPHIEQGPILDDSGESLGVVEAIVGMRHVAIELTGDQNHAGTTPMAKRRDAVAGFVTLASRINEAFEPEVGQHTVWTFGRLEISPNAVSIVPGRAKTILQIRDPVAERLDRLVHTALEVVRQCNADGRVDIVAKASGALDPVPMNRTVTQALEVASGEVAGSRRWRSIVSGALHDAVPISRVLPTGMLFVPSIGGKSHCFAEDTPLDDLVLGCLAVAKAIERLRPS